MKNPAVAAKGSNAKNMFRGLEWKMKVTNREERAKPTIW
jgi:hypothetical protein